MPARPPSRRRRRPSPRRRRSPLAAPPAPTPSVPPAPAASPRHEPGPGERGAGRGPRARRGRPDPGALVGGAARGRPAAGGESRGRRRRPTPLPEPSLPTAAEPVAAPAGDDATPARRGKRTPSTSEARSRPRASGTATWRRGAGGTTSGARWAAATRASAGTPTRRAGTPRRSSTTGRPWTPRRSATHWAGLAIAHARRGRSRARTGGRSSRASAHSRTTRSSSTCWPTSRSARAGRREAVETLKRLLARESGPRARPDAPAAARARAGVRGRLLEPGEPALPRPLRGRRRHRRGPVGGRQSGAGLRVARPGPRGLPEGAGPGGHLRDEDVRRDRRHPAGVRRARPRVLRLPEAAAAALGLPGGLDRARAARPPRVRAPPDPPGHEAAARPGGFTRGWPRSSSPAPRRGSSRPTWRWTASSITLAGLERLFRSNAVGAAYQLSHVVVRVPGGPGRHEPASARFLARLGQGEPLAQALKEGVGVSVEDVEARLLAAGGRS